MKNEIVGYLLGNLTLPFLIAFYIFALMGVIFSMFIHVKKKAKTKFSFKFWWHDNYARFFASFMSIYFVARFLNEFFTGLELNMFAGLVVGISLDQIIIVIRNKTNINLFQK